MTTLTESKATATAAAPDSETLLALLSQREREIDAKEREISFLREKLRLLQFRQFGKSSERVMDDAQKLLDLPQLAPGALPEEATTDVVHVSAHTKKKAGRRPIDPGLPREERVIDVPESEKRCAAHGVALEKIGEERSETIEHVPESFKVIVTVRPKYLCPCCEQKKVVIAPVAPRLIPKGIATPSLLAHIVLSKFVDHLPLYRQEAIFAREGFELSRGTMAGWIVRLGEALIPVTNLLQERLLSGRYLSCDETPMRVLTMTASE